MNGSIPPAAPPELPQGRVREQDGKDIVQSLIGAVPYTDLSLPELREERSTKYEVADGCGYIAN